MGKNWDFSGWATKANIRCSDGRTILKDAFKDCDGMTVPLVWNHRHNDPSEVLGHALLENRDDGVYAYCSFNDSEKGQEAKECVRHGDITQLSIFANNLKQSSSKPPCDVIHGMIREVSLVLAGANIGAFIDNVMAHGESDLEEAVIYHGEDEGLVLEHAEEEEAEEQESDSDEGETIEDILNTLSDKQKAAVGELLSQLTHSDESDTEETEEDEEEVEEESSDEEEDVDTIEDNTNEENENEMKHNVFDTYENDEMTLSHSDMQQIFKDAKRLGSLKDSIEENLENGVLAHAQNRDGSTQSYGIADIDYLFPDAKTLNNTPEFIKRDTGWVAEVINGTHHTPFSRVKSMFADIRDDEARAKGYIKGKLKKEEVFTLLKRATDPQTIYKKQKMDRDDIIDITDFNVVAWIKGEMRMMLEEEIARAILIGDGRNPSSDDKIQEAHVRPVYNDADLYTVKVPVPVAANATASEKAEALEEAVVRAFAQYKGSGNPTFFTTTGVVTDQLLRKDQIGHKIFKTTSELATALRVSKITEVEVMEGAKIGIKEEGSETTTQKDFIGVIVNLKDYNVGADKGGQTTMFEDFDIDYNQEKYLLETRMSGALVKPFSALSFYWEVE